MSTRGLWCIVANGNYCVAQYNHCDSYPSYGGENTLEFLRALSKDELEQLKVNSLTKVKFTKEELNCDDGIGVFKSILKASDTPIELYNDLIFAANSLFCEWAYIVDFDKYTFEIYKGFNQSPLENNERFYFLNGECEKFCYDGEKVKYWPIKLVKEWPLDELPTIEEFENFYDKLSLD